MLLLAGILIFSLLRSTIATSTASACGDEASDCSRLRDPLRQIALASDPLAAARERGLPIVGDQLRVVVELAPGGVPPTTVPITIEAQYEHLLQVLVAPEHLCRLAAAPDVAVVRLPYAAVPQRGVPPSGPPPEDGAPRLQEPERGSLAGGGARESEEGA